MRRRRKYLDQRQSDNHERWLVSYADFITLLFAFFVVMYALSTVSEGKYRVLSEALIYAFRNEKIPHVVPPPPAVRLPPVVRPPEVVQPLPHPRPHPRPHPAPKPRPLLSRKQVYAQARQSEEMRSMAQHILKVLDPLVRNGSVRVTRSVRGVAIEINASVLFASGQARLQKGSLLALRQVAQVLAPAPQRIEVEGYTDDKPISTGRFPSNWELSAARASSVVRLFIDNGVDPKRLSAVGYGPNDPIAPNDTPQGRSRNRRVTVMILADTPGKVVELPLETSGS